MSNMDKHTVSHHLRSRSSRSSSFSVLVCGATLALLSVVAFGCQTAAPSSQPPVAQAAVETITPTEAVPTTTPAVTPIPTPTTTPTPMPINFKSQFAFQPVAIMVDNLRQARPQSGLNRADVVYEALAEGGITRFMAIYANQDAEVVGPVRSGRQYFVYWAAEYNAMYAHIGAYQEAYNTMHATGTTDLDGLSGTGYFWRSNDRLAPHNAYTNTSKLRATAKDKGKGSLGGLTFAENSFKTNGDKVTEIKLNNPDGYRVASYTYSEQDNTYARSMEGVAHVDAYSGEQYKPHNVIVELLETWSLKNDSEGRVDMTMVGKGTAYIFTGGKLTKGLWIKDSLAKPTRYVDADGQNIRLNPGQTWIQVMPTSGIVEYR